MYLLCLSFLQAGFNEDQLAMMKNLHDQCVAETGVSEGKK